MESELTHHYQTANTISSSVGSSVLNLSLFTTQIHPPLRPPSMASSSLLLLSTPLSRPTNPSLLPRPSVYPSLLLHSKPLRFSSTSPPPLSLRCNTSRWILLAGSSIGKDTDTDTDIKPLLGEDSAAFHLADQKLSSWIYFSVILAAVLFALDVLWLDNSTGFGQSFLLLLESVSDSPEVVMLSLTLIFALVHSGLASVRVTGEKLIGERAFRVIFAGVSLPLAVSTVVYFINHRYDGVQLWQLQSVPGLHQLVWLSSFISFIFLYPSTFNLLEVAAVDKPKMHLWETGIMRITRHPQMVGQVIWCLAHTIWIGNSVAVAASLGLVGHHLFGIWNGDRRLASRYGEVFEAVKNRTSVVPFAAIIDGRQKLPRNYYKEFIRLPYFAIIIVTLGAYFAHPLMQAGSYNLHW